MKNITINITSKDLKENFSASGRVIDELAYCAGEWTEEDLYDKNIDYLPSEPYEFDHEGRTYEDFTEDNYKSFFIDTIISKGNARKIKDKAEREKRRAEREKEKEYKAKRQAEAEAEKIAKLKARVL